MAEKISHFHLTINQLTKTQFMKIPQFSTEYSLDVLRNTANIQA
jgi:hypothetical protein